MKAQGMEQDAGNETMAKRTSRKRWFWITGGLVLIIAGLVAGGLGLFGLLPWQGGDLYEDPQGRFTMEVDPSESISRSGP